MTDDERLVVDFLKSSPETFFSRKEISRKANRREEYEANPHWAASPLASLVEQRVIEKSDQGHYRLGSGLEEKEKPSQPSKPTGQQKPEAS